MPDPEQWAMTWMRVLGRHLAEVLTPLLPAGTELVASGRDVLLMVRPEGAPLRVATSYEFPHVEDPRTLGAGLVEEILRDVQDEVSIYLARAWPTSQLGHALAPRAVAGEGAVCLWFEPRAADSAAEIVLEPFVPPGHDARAGG